MSKEEFKLLLNALTHTYGKDKGILFYNKIKVLIMQGINNVG